MDGGRAITARIFEPQGWRERFREALVSIAIGFGIGFILWLGDSGSSLFGYLIVCGWIGLFIHAASTLFCFLIRPLIERLDGWRLRAFLGLIFFVAGAAGFAAGVHSLDWVLRNTTGGGLSMGSDPNLFLSLAFPGAVGLVVGLSFFSYSSLRARLEASVERIREQEYAERELETARAIQRRLLPPGTASGAGYRIAARNLPARQVAGDFYDILPDLTDRSREGDGSVGLVVADVSGKGMGASLVMASVKASLSFIAPGRSPAEVLAELNRRLVDELAPRDFVALCFVRYRPATGEFELANAGLPDPYLLPAPDRARDGLPRSIAPSGPRLPLGLRPDVAYAPVRGRLGPGERLLLVSDGLPEAQTSEGEPLGYGPFEELVASGAARDGDLARWLDDLFERLTARTLEARDDDWTALVLERDR